MLHSVMGKVMQEEGDEEPSSSSDGEDEERGQQQKQPKGKQQQAGSKQQQEGDVRSDDPSKQPEATTSAPSSIISNTVFVRGLALDTSSIELQLKMESYGPVHSCRCLPPAACQPCCPACLWPRWRRAAMPARQYALRLATRS
jgi:hypothetical protein